MSADERRTLRHAEALPILLRLKARFEEVRPTLRPTSKLAGAIDYVLNRWMAFVRYAEDGRIPIDNNVIVTPWRGRLPGTPFCAPVVLAAAHSALVCSAENGFQPRSRLASNGSNPEPCSPAQPR